MRKVRIHEMAKELGIASKDLVHIAQTLGYPISNHANTLNENDANELKSVIVGLASLREQRHAPKTTTPPKQATENVSNVEEQESLMLVNMGQHDVRVSENYEGGFYNMVKTLSALLADPRQTVRTESETVPWGSIYFLRADRSTPLFGYIELEYGDEEDGPSQRQKGFLGDLLWSGKWINESWTRPFEKLAQTMGVIRDPEADYRNQLAADLHSLEARDRIIGLDEWDIYTGIPGRNIYVAPKEEFVPEES